MYHYPHINFFRELFCDGEEGRDVRDLGILRLIVGEVPKGEGGRDSGHRFRDFGRPLEASSRAPAARQKECFEAVLLEGLDWSHICVPDFRWTSSTQLGRDREQRLSTTH